MTNATDRWKLPLLAAGQAQKEMTHNEALALIDLMVQPAVIAMALDTPPDTPEPGDCWVVGPAPSGAWTGWALALAGWTAGGWRFAPAREGMSVWNRASGSAAWFRDGAWRDGELRGAAVSIGGRQVVGAQAAAIREPSGGDTIDTAAREAIGAVLTALREHGLVAR